MFLQKNNFLSIRELSEIFKTYPSTIHRILETLKYRGYVEQDPVSKKYFLGLKLAELGMYKIDKFNLAKVAYPFLKELVDQFNENVYLATYFNKKVLYLEKVESIQEVTMSTHIGETAPLYCTALGKIFLASFSKEEMNKIVSSKLQALTENTIINKKLLKAEIGKVKRQGFALDRGEHEKDVFCVATSVLNHLGKVIGAISISLPLYRLSEKKLTNMKEALIQKSREISKNMGYREGGIQV